MNAETEVRNCVSSLSQMLRGYAKMQKKKKATLILKCFCLGKYSHFWLKKIGFCVNISWVYHYFEMINTHFYSLCFKL